GQVAAVMVGVRWGISASSCSRGADQVLLVAGITGQARFVVGREDRVHGAGADSVAPAGGAHSANSPVVDQVPDGLGGHAENVCGLAWFQWARVRMCLQLRLLLGRYVLHPTI